MNKTYISCCCFGCWDAGLQQQLRWDDEEEEIDPFPQTVISEMVASVVDQTVSYLEMSPSSKEDDTVTLPELSKEEDEQRRLLNDTQVTQLPKAPPLPVKPVPRERDYLLSVATSVV